MPFQRMGRLVCIMFIAMLGLQSVASAQASPTESQRLIVNRLYDELFNAADFAQVDTILASAYVNHGYGNADLSRDTFVAWIEGLHTAMPDFKATVEVLVVDGDWAASRVRAGGTFSKAWTVNGATYKPTDKPVTWTLNILHHFKDGVIAEDFTSFDYLSLLKQLGASPAPSLVATLLQSAESAPIVMTAAVTQGQESVHRDAFSHVINDSLNKGDLSAIETYMVADYKTYEPFGSFSREQFKGVVTLLRTIIPDLNVDIDTIVAEGDWLAARLIYTGTFSVPIEAGPITIPATNKPIRLIINVFVHFNAEGIAVEDYKEYNRLGWLVQAGLMK